MSSLAAPLRTFRDKGRPAARCFPVRRAEAIDRQVNAVIVECQAKGRPRS